LLLRKRQEIKAFKIYFTKDYVLKESGWKTITNYDFCKFEPLRSLVKNIVKYIFLFSGIFALEKKNLVVRKEKFSS